MIVLVGSRNLWPSPRVASAVAAAVASSDQIAVRCTSRGDVDSPVEKLALGLALRFRRPNHIAAPLRPGRAGVYFRDFDLVEHADRVIAFFAPGEEMEGGTGHVVKAALDRGVPCEAWSLDDEGELWLVGSDDGDPMRIRPSEPNELLRRWREMRME